MEVDSEKISNARQFIPYFDISNNFAWRDTRPEQIEQRRALLGDVLIFDMLLSSGGIKTPDALYPPTDVPALKHLLQVIEASHYDMLKKECLVYYLLKWHHDGREERFQMERCIPPHFAAAADAYWLLDTGLNIPHAISILSDARINQDYRSKVLQAVSLVPNPSALIVKYVRTARPALTEPHDLETYIIALAEASSFYDAWEYQRIFNDISPMRSRLFKKLLDWTVTPKLKSTALKQLLLLPLSQFEESILRSQALESSLPPSALAVLQDLVCVRLVQAGRHIEAIKTDHEFSASTSSKLRGLTAERTKMIQDLYSVLPATERMLLDEELKLANKQKSSSSEDLTTKKLDGDISLSSSWEDVRILSSPSPSHRNLKSLSRDPQLLSRSFTERIQAPRFSATVPQNSFTNKQPPLIATPAINISPTAPKPVSRKSFPLPFIPSAGVASQPAGRPRHSAGRLPLSSIEAPRAFPPISVPRRPSPERHTVTANGASETLAFPSASKSKNAFFGPSRKPNVLVDHNPPENHVKEADETQPRSRAHEDVDMEIPGPNEEHDRHADMAENAPELQYSIFGNHGSSQHTQATAPNGQYSLSSEQGKRRKGVPPGAFLSDEDDALEDELENVPWQNSIAPPTTESTLPPVNPKKREPTPDKKSTRPKQPVSREVRQLKRSLPGALMEEEEDDYLAPLRQPSPPRRPLRKGRSSMSSDLGDEPEVPQTRRRSSRISSQVNTALLDMSPKKSSASTRTRKSTSTKKKR